MLCLGRSRSQNPRGLRPLGFWPWDLPRHNIHHDTSKAFSNNVPVYSQLVIKNVFELLAQFTCPPPHSAGSSLLAPLPSFLPALRPPGGLPRLFYHL